MADQKLSDLTAAGQLTSTDLLLLSQGIGGTPSSRKLALGNLIPGIYSVKQYGAVGDGTTDDAAAIQACIDAAAAAGGGMVYFPNGKYRLESDLVYNNLTSAVSFQGNSATKSFGSYPYLGSCLYRVGDGCVVRMNITGSYGSYAGVNSVGPTKSAFRNLTFAGDGSSTQTGIAHFWSRITVRDCTFYNLSNDIDGSDTFKGTGAYAHNYNDMCCFQNLRFGNTRNTCIMIRGCDAAIMQGLHIEGPATSAVYGIKIEAGAGLVMRDILINGLPTTGIYLTNAWSFHLDGLYCEFQAGYSCTKMIDSYYCRANKFENVYVKQNESPAAPANLFYLHGTEPVLIENCYIKMTHSGTYDIFRHSMSDVTVRGMTYFEQNGDARSLVQY